MFNKVVLIGNLTRDVELRYSNSGTAMAKFGLAVNRAWKDRNSGEKREDVCYVDINIFGRSAEIANLHLSRGKRILVEGRLVFEQWQDQNGQKRSRHSIVAESFQFLDVRESNGQGNAGYQDQSNHGQYDSSFDMNNQTGGNQSNPDLNGTLDIEDDDIPF